MSFTITAQAIPSVAASPWDVVDAHLFRESGDWVILRGGLIHLLCDRVTRDEDPVTRLEEALLDRFYAAPPVRVSFLDVLAFVRKEIAAWPAEVAALVERVLAENPDFPVGEPAFPLSFDRLRAVATAGWEVCSTTFRSASL